MKKIGKKYQEALNKIEKRKAYNALEAAKLAKATSVTKFVSSVEVSIKLNIDTKKADQQMRGVVLLPNGTGKTKKTLVVCNASKFDEAKDSGTDYYGDKDIIEKIEKENFFDYDVIIATPDMMPLLGKLGKVLGPKGLMPNPKTGTVTNDIKRAVNDVKGGQVEYRADSYGIIHGIIGNTEFSEDKLAENLKAYMSILLKAKPQTVKGKYIQSVYLSTTMGPSIKVDELSFDN